MAVSCQSCADAVPPPTDWSANRHAPPWPASHGRSEIDLTTPDSRQHSIYGESGAHDSPPFDWPCEMHATPPRPGTSAAGHGRSEHPLLTATGPMLLTCLPPWSNKRKLADKVIASPGVAGAGFVSASTASGAPGGWYFVSFMETSSGDDLPAKMQVRSTVVQPSKFAEVYLIGKISLGRINETGIKSES